MPRRPRFVMPGIPHHVTQRGNHREDVFASDQDRRRYLEILRRHSARHGLRFLAWCLMTNHVHLIAIPDHADSLGMALGHAHSQYSLEQNKGQQRVGHLWQNRFFSCPLESAHVFSAMQYVDLNPVRAGMVTDAWNWRWSSAMTHVSTSGARDVLLDWAWDDWIEDARLGWWDYPAWKASLGSAIGDSDLERIRRATRLSEPLGSTAFLARLEQQAGRRLRVFAPCRPFSEKLG